MMKWSVAVGLAVALLAVGVAGLLTYLGWPSHEPLLPPQLADTPLIVLDPPAPDSDLRPLVALPDLSKVDRRFIEPAGLIKPRYCLLVFGLEAKTRVWIVEDGETLYVDRNANGDLTEPSKAIAATERQEYMTVGEGGKLTPYREWTYSAGDVSPGDGSGRHTDLKLVRYQTGDMPVEYVLSVWVGGVTLQYAGWRPLFAESRDRAAVVHFGGPVVPKPLRGSALHLSEDRQELHFCIGTPGLGSDSFAYVAYAAVPSAIRPVAEVAWPTGAAVLKERFALARRC
jgi:hypothetical protein